MEKKKSLFVLLACALFASVLGGATPLKTPEIEVNPTQTPSTSTSGSPTTTDAPPASTTTPAPPTPAPPTPAPPTPAPPTPAPPTPAPPTPAPPTTTTPSAPTTPVPPTPTPVPSDGRGNWTVKGDNVTCIIAQMILSAKIDYPLETANQTGKLTVSVPPNATAHGSCDPTSQWINITWSDNSIQVEFNKNDTTKMYYISKIDFSIFADSKVFRNISNEYANKSYNFVRVKEDFMINLNQSFRCTREQVLPLPKNESAIHAELALSSVQLQAFHTENTQVFGAAQDCELDTPDIVPIAVGCALAALVCVVLVAYLVGRRRSQARGYLSM